MSPPPLPYEIHLLILGSIDNLPALHAYSQLDSTTRSLYLSRRETLEVSLIRSALGEDLIGTYLLHSILSKIDRGQLNAPNLDSLESDWLENKDSLSLNVLRRCYSIFQIAKELGSDRRIPERHRLRPRNVLLKACERCSWLLPGYDISRVRSSYDFSNKLFRLIRPEHETRIQYRPTPFWTWKIKDMLGKGGILEFVVGTEFVRRRFSTMDVEPRKFRRVKTEDDFIAFVMPYVMVAVLFTPTEEYAREMMAFAVGTKSDTSVEECGGETTAEMEGSIAERVFKRSSEKGRRGLGRFGECTRPRSRR